MNNKSHTIVPVAKFQNVHDFIVKDDAILMKLRDELILYKIGIGKIDIEFLDQADVNNIESLRIGQLPNYFDGSGHRHDGIIYYPINKKNIIKYDSSYTNKNVLFNIPNNKRQHSNFYITPNGQFLNHDSFIIGQYLFKAVFNEYGRSSGGVERNLSHYEIINTVNGKIVTNNYKFSNNSSDLLSVFRNHIIMRKSNNGVEIHQIVNDKMKFINFFDNFICNPIHEQDFPEDYFLAFERNNKTLVIYKFEEKQLDDKTCAICLEEIMQRIVINPCGHANFCKNCKANVDKLKKCPICNQDIINTILMFA